MSKIKVTVIQVTGGAMTYWSVRGDDKVLLISVLFIMIIMKRQQSVLGISCIAANSPCDMSNILFIVQLIWAILFGPWKKLQHKRF